MYKVELKKIENSDKFRKPAIYFTKHGYYTNAPRGTTEYKKYWDQEIDRCLYGYITEDGEYITGYNYFYLNYCTILIINKKKIKLPNGKIVDKSIRERDFPRFYDYDKAYFDAIQEAENNGKHLAVIKARNKGYSFKGASMLCRNYFLIRESTSFAVAAEKEFLTKDGIVTKAWDIMDFIDQHTAWSKKRQKTDQLMHKRASIVIDVDGVKSEAGYKSEIIAVTLKNDVQKIRGKRAKLILFEEAGKFPGLKDAWRITDNSVEEDGIAFGLRIVFGTGGDVGTNFEGLQEIFYEPDAYNCLPIENTWDEAREGTECGFFVPAYVNVTAKTEEGEPMMDENGNSIIHEAIKYYISKRKVILDKASDKRAIDQYIAENPHCPQEAVLNISSNIFPKEDLIRHLNYIRNNKKLKHYKQVGDLYFDSQGKLQWKQSTTPNDLTKYRVSKDDDPTGSIVIWEHPIESPPYGLYIAGCLTPGEKVITNKGLMNVEDVSNKEKLVNRDGKLVDIINFQKRWKEDHDVYRIKPFGSYRTTNFTEEHPLLIKDEFIKTKDLKVGDVLTLPNIYFEEKNNYKEILKNYFNNEIDIEDKRLWWFLGIWLGDGFNNLNRNSRDIYVAFGKNQIEESLQFDNIIKSIFNRKTVHCKWNGGNTRRFTYKELYNLLEEEFGKYSYGKNIPDWVKFAPHKLKEAFILGYLDSDGSAFLDRGKIRINFTSVNLELLESLQDILYSLKIITSITKHSSSGKTIFNGKEYKTRESYRLSILKSGIKKFKNINISGIESRKLIKIITNSSNLREQTGEKAVVSSCGKYIYLPIQNIEKSKYTGIVYNFECETHTYMCRNIVTHNCDPLNLAA